MSTLLATRSHGDLPGAPERRRHEPRPAGGRSTLEQVVSGAWKDLATRALAACPACGDEMRAPGSGLPAACRGCGSELF